MHAFQNPILLWLKHRWQRLTRGYGDDEIDWELREKIAADVKKEMEDKFGSELTAMREHKRRYLACVDVVADKSMPRESKISKIHELFPDATEEHVAQRAEFLARLDDRA